MNRQQLLYVISGLALFGVGVVVGVFGWITISGGSGEASEPVRAPTLDINAVPTIDPDQAFIIATENADLQTQVVQLQADVDAANEMAEQAEADLAAANTQVAEAEQAVAQAATEAEQEAPEPTVVEPTEVPTEAPTATATEAPTEIPTEAPTATETEEVAAVEEEETTAARALFRITTEESEVRFNIDETLRGDDITVVGTTDQVAGDIIVDFSNPSSSTVGTIVINARTLETDNMFRNRALRSSILRSAQDEFEFSEFVPTELSGLPDSVAVGDTIEFEIVGDLTVAGVTQPVTFVTTVNIESEGRISGLATATVLYDDFNITIPDVSGVTNIADEVILEIDFVALMVEQA